MSAPNYAEIARRGAAAFRAQNPYDQGGDLWAAFEAGRILGERRQPVPRRLTAAAARSLIANPPAAPRGRPTQEPK